MVRIPIWILPVVQEWLKYLQLHGWDWGILCKWECYTALVCGALNIKYFPQISVKFKNKIEGSSQIEMLTALSLETFLMSSAGCYLLLTTPHLRRQVKPSLCNWKSSFYLIILLCLDKPYFRDYDENMWHCHKHIYWVTTPEWDCKLDVNLLTQRSCGCVCWNGILNSLTKHAINKKTHSVVDMKLFPISHLHEIHKELQANIFCRALLQVKV